MISIVCENQNKLHKCCIQTFFLKTSNIASLVTKVNNHFPPVTASQFDQNWLPILMSWKSTTETNAHNFCLKNKLTRYNNGRNIIKIL